MSFDSHLIHTCTIERAYQSGTNVHGLDSDRYSVIAFSQACRLVVNQERIGISERAERPVVTVYKLLLPANANIAQKDRITAVTLEDGTVMSDKFVVEAILPRRGRTLRHVSVSLEKVA